MNEHDEVILEDEQVEDEIVEQDEVEAEAEPEEQEEENPYRSKLNATNRFLQKEGYKFENGSWVKDSPTVKAAPIKKSVDTNITPLDTLAFIDAGVTNVDDISEVVKLAKGFSLSIADALRDTTVKHRLNVLKEERKTAEATNTRTARKGATQTDSRQLLDNLSRGEVPTSRNEAEDLFWARRGGRRS